MLDLDNLSTRDTRFKSIEKLVYCNEYKERIYISRYSFETWLLNHKTYFGVAISDKSQYDYHMKKYFSISHWRKEKNERNRKVIINSISVDDVDRAIKNCQSLYNNAPDNVLQKNPVSTILI